MYDVYFSATFKQRYGKLTLEERRWIDAAAGKLQTAVTGDILRFSWFREKKCGSKRLYFVVDEGSKRILFLAFAPKKEQQEIIGYVVECLPELLAYLRSL